MGTAGPGPIGPGRRRAHLPSLSPSAAAHFDRLRGSTKFELERRWGEHCAPHGHLQRWTAAGAAGPVRGCGWIRLASSGQRRFRFQRDRVAAGRCRPPGDLTRRGPGRARAPSPSSESRHCASSRSLLSRNSGAAVVVTSKLSLAWTPAKPGSQCWQPGMQVQVPASGIRTPWMRMARGIPVYTGKYR